LILTCVELGLDWYKGVSAIEKRVDEIQDSYTESMSKSLWDLDFNMLNIQMRSIQELATIESVTVVTIPDNTPYQVNSDVAPKYPIQREVTLQYKDQNESFDVGILQITADKKIVYDKLINDGLWILFTQAIKSMIVSACILFVLYIFFLKRILLMTEYTRAAADMKRPTLFIESGSEIGSSAKDELSDMIQGVNSMHSNLLDAIDQLKKKEKELIAKSTHDSLTGVRSRSSGMNLLSFMMTNAHRNKEMIAIIYVDLDHFKIINDTLGHPSGDMLLRTVSKMFTQCIRENDVIARIGGDEFVIILGDIKSPSDVQLVVDRIYSLFTQPIDLSGTEVVAGLSMGAAIYPNDGEDVDSLIKHADVALYEAKAAGRNNFMFFNSSMNNDNVDRLRLTTQLHKALDNDEFFLHYQPILDCKTNQLTGVEVLLRWNNPVHGMVPPDKFIPLCEENGLIRSIGDFVIKRSFEQVSQWIKTYNIPIRLSVNVSSRQLMVDSFADFVFEQIANSGLAANMIELEITERVLLENNTTTASILKSFRDQCIRLSLDDFGTGHSALSYLRDFPFTTLKIDRSFVKGLPDDADSVSLSKAIIDVAQCFSLEVIGEGIETQEQYDFIRNSGVNKVQGYFLSRPIPRDEFEALWLQKQQGNDLLSPNASDNSRGRTNETPPKTLTPQAS
jgi:diguanylate cyclase (GGDEF)-like protein